MADKYPAALKEAIKRALAAHPEVPPGAAVEVATAPFGEATIVVDEHDE